MTGWVDFKSKWLKIAIIAEYPKTKSFGIYSKDGHFLGMIEWRNGWRQYVLEPIRNTTWAVSCLNDVIRFIGEQMELKKDFPLSTSPPFEPVDKILEMLGDE